MPDKLFAHRLLKEKYYPDLLQEAEEQEAKEENADVDVTTEANKSNEKYGDVVISLGK